MKTNALAYTFKAGKSIYSKLII